MGIWTRTLATTLLAWIPAWGTAAPGDIDLTFGAGGWVATPYGALTQYASYPDGRLLAAPNVATGTVIRLMRLTRDGQPDPTWGTGGESVIDMQGIAPSGTALRSNQYVSVDVQADGSAAAIYDSRLLFRLRPDGSVDRTFAGSGVLTGTEANSAGYPLSVMSDGADGWLVGLGCLACSDGYPEIFNLVGLSSTGAKQFESATVNVEPYTIGFKAARRLSSGQIVVVASVFSLISRLNADGTPDTGYAYYANPGTRSVMFLIGSRMGYAYQFNNGLTSQTYVPDARITSAFIDAQGRVTLAIGGFLTGGGLTGSDRATAPQRQFAVLARFDANGQLDPTFGTDGTGIWRPDWSATPWASTTPQGDDFTLTVSPSGNLVLSGRRYFLSDSQHQGGFLWYLTADGRAPPGRALGGLQLLGVDNTAAQPGAVQLRDNGDVIAGVTPGRLARLGASTGPSPGLLVGAGGSATEADTSPAGGTTTLRIPLTRFAGSAGALVVDFTTAENGSATAGSDFLPVSGRLTWADGETGTKFIDVPIVDDTLQEGRETFEIQLTRVSGSSVATSSTLGASIAASDTPAATASTGTAGTATPATAASAKGGGGSLDLPALLALSLCALAVWRRRTAMIGITIGVFALGCAMRSSPVAAAPGDLDPSFGTAGVVAPPYGANTRYQNYADGRLLAYPWGEVGGLLHVRRLTSDGRTDTTWGTAGEALVDINSLPVGVRPVAANELWPVAAAGNGDGSVYLAYARRVVRLLADGRLDRAFAGGVGAIDLASNGQLARTVNDPAVMALEAQTDGSLLILLGCNSCDDYPTPENIVRVLPDGSYSIQPQPAPVKTGVPNAGLPAAIGYWLVALRRLADGRTLVVGPEGILCFRADGQLDTTYAGEGVAHIFPVNLPYVLAPLDLAPLIRSTTAMNFLPSGPLGIQSAAIAPDGRITLIISGSASETGANGATVQVNRRAAMRLDASGQPDLGFGGSGSVAVPSDHSVLSLNDVLGRFTTGATYGGTPACSLLRSVSLAPDSTLHCAVPDGRDAVTGLPRSVQFAQLAPSILQLRAGGDIVVAANNNNGNANFGSTLVRLSGSAPDSAGLLVLESSGGAFDESAAPAGGTVAKSISVARVGGRRGAVSVDYATAVGGANPATPGSDYTATSGRLTWADGDTASQSFTVTIFDDGVAELPEQFQVLLTNPSGGALLATPGTGEVTIYSRTTPTTGTSVSGSNGTSATGSTATAGTTTDGKGGGGGMFDLTGLWWLAAVGLFGLRRLRRPRLTAALVRAYGDHNLWSPRTVTWTFPPRHSRPNA